MKVRFPIRLVRYILCGRRGVATFRKFRLRDREARPSMKINGYLLKSTIVAASGRSAVWVRHDCHLRNYSRAARGVSAFGGLAWVHGRQCVVGHGNRLHDRGYSRRPLRPPRQSRIMAVLYLLTALGSAFAWNWDALIFFRFLGGLGDWRVVGAGPDVHRGNRSGQLARAAGGLFSSTWCSESCWHTSRIT